MDTYVYFCKNYCFISGVTCLLFLSLLLNFKITDYNNVKLVVSKKSLLKAPAISVDQKQPRRGVL